MLFLFLGSVRAALLTAITIPLSLLFAFVCMHFTGIPANLLSLGALDFGIIVDGTLVMVEHIVHTLDEAREAPANGTAETRVAIAAHHSRSRAEVEAPIFFSLLIIISAYIPLFTLERVERRLFTPMAFTVCYALLGLHAAGPDADSRARHLPVPEWRQAWENPVLAWLRHGLPKASCALAVHAAVARRSDRRSPCVVAAFALGTAPGLGVPAAA